MGQQTTVIEARGMAVYMKRGTLLVLPAVAILLLVAFVPACGDTGSEPPPRQAPPSEQAAPANTRVPDASAGQRPSALEPSPTVAPASPTPTPAPQSASEPSPTVAPASPTPTPAPQSASEPSPTVVPASPTPTPAPKPAGYLHGAEHGVALLQTTRRPSETRDGWMDITLTLATLKFGGDAASRRHKVEANSMCYMNRQPPHDCLFVAWGSQEQFEAELTASHPVSDSGSPFQTDILVVAFEVAANATNASLYFGDKHKIPLDLQGDETRVESSASPAPAPTPGASSGQSAGYFMDADYGIAITGVRREPFSAGSTLSLVDVDISVISLRGENGLAPEVNVGVDHSSDVCLGYSPRLECLKVRWGPESQFEAALFLGNEISAEWPRGRGLPIRFGLAVPNSAEQAVIEFGEHRIPIDLRDMTGETPTYDYRLHYQEFTVGSTLYDSNQKKVVLEQVRQEADTGGVTLVFSATNDSEATDFAPVIELAGSRVSESGRVFDGEMHPAAGWTPQTVRIEGEKLAPGQSNLVEYTIARVAGKDLEHWRFIRYSPNAEERPSGVVLQLTVRDSETDAGTRVSESGHLSYDRTGEESGYWPERVPSISSGARHTCVLTADGLVVCWGDNDHGQSTPPEGDTFASISSGSAHTCGLRADGSAVCWGRDDHGESTPPEGVIFISISGGGAHTCGLRADGTPICWGRNTDRHDSFAGQATPPEDEAFVSISGGGDHTCGLRADGTVRCWGWISFGANSPPDDRLVALSDHSYWHTCGLRPDGTAICWGLDNRGQASPPGGVSFSSITSGDVHTCGLHPSGTVLCWGSNHRWNGSPFYGQATPPEGETFSAVSAGYNHACGLTFARTAIICWGDNSRGQSAPPDDLRLPAPVAAPVPPTPTPAP